MASSSSLGNSSTTSASKAQVFYDRFNSSIQTFRSSIENAKTTAQLDQVLVQISTTREELTQATHVLPSHDRQTHEKSLRELNRYLTERRKQLQPAKVGFLFKRKPKDPTTATASPTNLPPPPPSSSELEGESKQDRAESVQDPSFEQPCLGNSTTPFVSLSSSKRSYHDLDSILSQSSYRDDHQDQRLETLSTDLHLSDMESCLVDLRVTSDRKSPIKALQMRNLRRCIVLTGNVDGSVMIHDCQDSLLVVGCRQFRMHTSSNNKVVIHSQSLATMEDCQGILFRPFSRTNTNVSENPWFQKSEGRGWAARGCEDEEFQVQDFDHIRQDQPSPNWEIMKPEVWKRLEEDLETYFQDASSSSSLLALMSPAMGGGGVW
ncbi:hypothetical protein IE53DRAFT_366265 [Violaceomyces palustris]|uniref:Uncharacterized protein n=1 Tax=Violaceomyces palustris TaxID=1673888 RepID=A0ACD0P631_9BASI|nr:hypothetical protein IE53DRAFT_366265 [Violaceomyces palustris]